MRRAKESKFVKRLRKKIKKEIKLYQKTLTKSKLQTLQKIIRQQLQRDAKLFQPLGEKSITVFDENNHPAPTKSDSILQLQKKIEAEFSKFQDVIDAKSTENPTKTDFSHQ